MYNIYKKIELKLYFTKKEYVKLPNIYEMSTELIWTYRINPALSSGLLTEELGAIH